MPGMPSSTPPSSGSWSHQDKGLEAVRHVVGGDRAIGASVGIGKSK